MPSGRTHDRITGWTLPLIAGATFLLTQRLDLTLIVSAGFLVGGLVFGPDLDTHSVHYKRWGWLRWIWLPYRGSLRHRSPYSHGPITGTLVRLLYLSFWLGALSLAIVTLTNQIWNLGWTWETIGQTTAAGLRQYGKPLLAFAIGLELGAFSHYTADWLVSAVKRSKRKGGRSKNSTNSARGAAKRRRKS